jgi:hypothetical protein
MRLLFAGLAATGALVLAGVASAGSHPVLFVSNLDSYIKNQELFVAVPTNDPAVAEATMYVGPGVTLTAQPTTTFGEAAGEFMSNAAYGSSIFEMAGDVVSANPTLYQNNDCSPGLHAAVWLVSMTPLFLNVTIRIPIYVDPAPAGRQSYASYVLKTCMPSPYLPYPGGAIFGSRMLDLFLYLGNFQHAGDSRWTTVVTPFMSSGGTNPQGAAEAQAVVSQGSISKLSVKLKAKKHGKRTQYFAHIHGRVTNTAGAGIPSTVDVYQLFTKNGGPEVASRKTSASGAFHLTVRQKRTASYGVVSTRLGDEVTPAVCNPVLNIGFGSLPCASLTTSDFQSARVSRKVRIPKGGAGISASRATAFLRGRFATRASGKLLP